MPKVAVVTDSAASIPEDMLRDLEIHWVPYYIHRGAEVLRDLVTIQRKAFYDWLPTATEAPSTASPGPGDYIYTYEQLVEEEGVDAIVSIHMTSKGSGAYQAAVNARELFLEKYPKLRLEVIDTLNVSMCHGWMSIEAARMALDKKSLTEIVQRVKEMIPITQMIQTADTLKYLYLGGRIGKAGHLVGSLLNIKPLISMRNGEIVPLGVTRSREKAYQKMVELVGHAVGMMGKIKVAYVHAAAEQEVLRLKELVEKNFTIVESCIAELSPALGVHTGPGTIGLCYYPII